MVLLRSMKCSLGYKCNIKQIVFLCLVIFILIFLAFTNISRLSVKLVNSYIQILNMFPKMIGYFQTGGSQPDPGNWLCNTTQPESNSTEELQKLLCIYDYIINEPDKCNDSVPFLILLITVERWQKEARQAIRQTWGKEDLLPGVKLLRLFLLGKDIMWTDDAQQSLLEESQAYHDIIQQDYLDSYHNLTTKVLMGFNWVATHCPGASYVMKSDSDMFINTEYLIKGLLKPDQPLKLNYVTGYLLIDTTPVRYARSKWYMSPQEYPEDKYPLYCAGAFYVFSAGLASKIVEVSPTVRWIHFEDLYFGLCLKQLGVQPVATSKDTDFNMYKVPYTDCGYNTIVSSHGFSPGELISTWNQLQKNKHGCV